MIPLHPGSRIAEMARLEIQLKPGAKTPGVRLSAEGILHIRIQEKPIEGRANRALRKKLSKTLKRPQSAIEIIRGESARRKSVSVADMETGEALDRLVRDGIT
ncbi:MAG: DUF167 domain-containing protein [Fibrobacterota bacterium]